MLLNCFYCVHEWIMVLNTCIHSFVCSAREQFDKLDLLHKNMERQYSDLGKYYVFDPKKISADEFFGELNNFKNMFLVCFMLLSLLSLILFKTGAGVVLVWRHRNRDKMWKSNLLEIRNSSIDTIKNESDTFLFSISTAAGVRVGVLWDMICFTSYCK